MPPVNIAPPPPVAGSRRPAGGTPAPGTTNRRPGSAADRAQRRARPVAKAIATLFIILLVGAEPVRDAVLPGTARGAGADPLHAWLKPSGWLGQGAGVLALAIFLFLWLYPLRKKFRWLAFTGSIAKWLDVHSLAALGLPLLVAMHAAWRFGGVIGLGFWSMMVVWASGIVGRYLYCAHPPEPGRRRAHDRGDRGAAAGAARGDRRSAPASRSPPSRRRSRRSLAHERARPLADVPPDDRGRPEAPAQAATSTAARDPAAPAAPAPRRHGALREVVRLANREMALVQQARMLGATHNILRFWHVAHRPLAITALAGRDHPRRGGRVPGRHVVLVAGRIPHGMPGLLRAVALSLACWLIMAAPLRAQISPGPLATAHASLEGPAQCTQCHGSRREPMGTQCLACHKDMSWLTERSRGFHGTAEVKGTPCASCHPDHAGTDFNMVKWPDGSAAKFDHRRAGWALRQKHAEAECRDCHVAKYEVSPAAKLSARKTGQGYTGLETTCTSCHEDVHRSALGTTCTTCHDAASWTVTPGFNHDTTAYELTGKHEPVKCDKCHLDPRLSPKSDGKGHLVPVYKPVSFGTCADCHTDPHAGKLGPKCADCHTTAGFKVIDKNRFDHDRTKYPLAGKHATVACAACHKDFSTPALKSPAFATCASCHRDAHNGTATVAGKPADCAACHTVSGLHALDVHRREPRDGEVSARGQACQRQVRRLPREEHDRDGGHAVRQLEGRHAPGLCALHRLPRRRPRRPAQGIREPGRVLRLPPRSRGGRRARSTARRTRRPRLVLDGRHQEVDLRRLPRRHARRAAAACRATWRWGRPISSSR